MDLEFQLREVNRSLIIVLHRRRENASYSYRIKDGLKVLFEGEEARSEVDLGQITGRQLILAFVEMFDHRWYNAGRMFSFRFPLKGSLQIQNDLSEQTLTSCTPMASVDDLCKVNKEHFKAFFKDFVSKPLRLAANTDTSSVLFWDLSISLLLEVAKRVIFERDDDEYKYIGVPAAIATALELSIASDMKMFDVFVGFMKDRRKAADKILDMYTKHEVEKIVNDFFNEKLQATNLKEVTDVTKEKAEDLILSSFQSYLHVTIENLVNDLFVETEKENGPAEQNNNESDVSNPNEGSGDKNQEEVVDWNKKSDDNLTSGVKKDLNEVTSRRIEVSDESSESSANEDVDSDEESESVIDHHGELLDRIRSLCCCVHGEYIAEDDWFELSNKSADEVRRDVMKHIWRLLFKEEYEFEDEGPRVVRGRRLVD